MTLSSEALEDDQDIRAALAWLARVSGDEQAFEERLARAQQAYRTLTASPGNLGRDPSLASISSDIVGAYFAQAHSMLSDRRSFDLALAPHIIPWVKQLGRNIDVIPAIPGAADRAARMLRAEAVCPDAVMFELAMASNYAIDGLDVAFVEEAAGRTPDISVSTPELDEPFFIECKRLRRGTYENEERDHQTRLFRNAEVVIFDRLLSVHIDVTYTRELAEIPDHYLADRLLRAVSSPIITPGGYPWNDEFGFGIVKPANLAAVRSDIRDNSLYFGTKLARLLSGHAVRENGYHLAARADADDRDPRFIQAINHGSVVTWQCIAPAAIEKKARFVRKKLAEADEQLATHGLGIAHLAMDMELQSAASDLRRERNQETITTFRPTSDLLAVYLHYLVPRISENHAWLIDETVDIFGQGDDPMPKQAIFPGSSTFSDTRPAWRQEL